MNKNLENNLKFLKLTTMSDCYKNECNNINNESVETVLDLIVKAEINQRKSNKINRLINDAGLFHNINLNDLKIDESRGLEKKYLSNFLQLHFLQCNLSIIITGPTGSGKTFLAQAIGYQACINLYKPTFRTSFHIFRFLLKNTIFFKNNILKNLTLLHNILN